MLYKYLKKAIKLFLGINQSTDNRFSLHCRDQDLLFSIGQLHSKQMISTGIKTFDVNRLEFKVFSQWGDDGLIHFLINKLDISQKFFVEFGVENYLEANTRFLLMNNNWSGLVMDGSPDNINYIKNDNTYWKYDLIAKAAFITAENINQLLKDSGITGKIGLLHIDIDGNDYWIWKAINVIDPDIVIVEYNSVFGIERPITIPYKADFVRSKAHYSHLYAGASLKALCYLAQKKGYSFIGSNSAGNNAYFVKDEKLGGLHPLTPEQGYVESKFREARNTIGELIYTRGPERIKLIQGLPVYNVITQEMEKI